jgi:DNA helicase-2/ATP-dependent DNA helicase PcrA
MKPSDEQLKIIRSPRTGTTAVRAVAGAGKTAVLIERARYLLEPLHAPLLPSQIWFLSFTRATDLELSNRLREAKLRCRTLTLHRFALQQLPEKVSILEEEPQVWNAILAELQLRHTRFRTRIARELDLIWQQPDLAPIPAQRALADDAQKTIGQRSAADGRLYLTYTQVLASVLRYWRDHPGALAKTQADCRALIVDEYQDVSPLQARFIDVLAGKNPLMVVGDASQAIFGFQGADPEVFQRFCETADRTYTLSHNYRSPALHLLAAQRLIDRPLVPATGFHGSLSVDRSTSELELMNLLPEVTSRLVDQCPPGDVVVLVRDNQRAEQAAALLREAGLSVRTTGESKRRWNSWIRTVLWPASAFLSGLRIGRHPLCGLHDAELSDATVRLLNVAWQTCQPRSVVMAATDEARRLLEVWEQLEDVTAPMALFETLTALYPAVDDDAQQARHECWSAQDDLTVLYRRLQGAADEKEVQVNVSTIHAAKGRQWSGVVVYEPGSSSRQPNEVELAEEQRLRYVALTRSLEHLAVLVHSDAHPAYEEAFEPRFMQDLTRLHRLMIAQRLKPADLDWITALQTRWPTLRLYLDTFGHRHSTWLNRTERSVGSESEPTRVKRRPLS